MIKKTGILGKLFKGKKKESSCCSFEIEEVNEETIEEGKENKCCDTSKKKTSCCK